MQKLVATEADAGKRLDVFIAEQISQLSRGFIQQLSKDNKISVNKEPEKPGHKVRPNDTIEIDYDLKQLEAIPAIDLPVLYEDDDCMVLNKPVGILTHAKGSFYPEPSVASFIKPHLKNLSGNRAGIVHRLDRSTSGAIIVAKTPEALAWLQKQFSQRKVKKTYYAVVEGTPEPPEAIIDIPIERNPKHPQTFRAGANGKPAVTKYRVVQSGPKYSLLKLEPETGRTHQLRVHLAYLHHPILGDALYHGQPAKRLYLHAAALELTLPNRQRHTFKAPVPKNFKAQL